LVYQTAESQIPSDGSPIMGTKTEQQKGAPVHPEYVAFSKTRIGQLPSPESGRRYYYDEKTPGLAVCVTAAGTKTFYFNRKIKGKATRTRLGRFPGVSVEQARKVAKKLAGKVAEGIDPTILKRAYRDAPTLQELFEHWIAHAKLHKKTWKDDERQFKKYVRSLKNRKLGDITTADIAKWHSAIGRDHGPYQANRARALLSAMFNKAHEVGHVGPNPCEGVKRFREESRERFLQPDELKPFFEALKEEPPLWRDFWLLCLFSGARRGNVAGMAWRDVDLEQGIWYLPGGKTKGGLPLAIVLPPPAVAVLRTRRKEVKGSEWVFPADTESGHVADPRKSWARVVRRSGIDNLRPHDLRRSLGSWQAIAGASLQVIGASLGHKNPNATAIYSRLLLDPVRASVSQAVDSMVQAGGYLLTEGNKDEESRG